MYWPDYQGGSIVNLMQRLRLARDGCPDPRYPPLEHTSLKGLEQQQVVVLFVIDGLGYSYLQNYARDSFLYSRLKDSLTAGFPPTTAASISTFLTGDAVQQHALTGWFVYLEEVDAVTAVLPGQLRGTNAFLQDRGLGAADIYGHRPFFSDLGAPSEIVAPNWIINTDFNRAHTGPAGSRGYDDMHGMFDQLRQAVQGTRERRYIYAYWPEFDRLSHEYGNASEQVAAHFAELDQAFARFVEQLNTNEVSIIVTADHGFIDTEPERVITLNDHPRLQRTLARPLCGEPRAAYCYVHRQYESEFVDYVEGQWGEFMACHRSGALVEQGLFGKGEAHPRLHQRLGDYTLLMKDNYVIKDWLPGEKRFFHRGIHGGVSEQEMRVPLIVI